MPADDALLRILIIGDIVGSPGRDAAKAIVPRLRDELELDLVIANAENAAAGSGITLRIFRELKRAGIDVMTMGDHTWRRKDNLEVLKREDRLLRPHNYPTEALGTGTIVVSADGGVEVGLVTVLGRIFMDPVACPFKTVDAALASFPDSVRVRIVEVHAEATSEKISMGWHLDGKVTCVFGTHTHVPTADDRVLPGGTAYISDLGMTGPYDGVIGRNAEAVLHKFITSMHATFGVASDNVRLCGILLEVEPESGKATSIRRVDIPLSEDKTPGAGSTPNAIQEI